MQDTRLYEQILGLGDPWRVVSVDLQVSLQEVHLRVDHSPEAVFVCPECSKPAPLYDHAAECIWRHLDTCQFKTYLHARVPRVNCSEHGIGNAEVPWGRKNGRFTLLMERLIIDLLLACQNVQSVCRLVSIGWDAVAGVMKRAVVRGQIRRRPELIKQMGVDEKAYQRGHQYLTVVSDLEKGAVEYVSAERTSESLAGFYRQLSPEQLLNTRFI